VFFEGKNTLVRISQDNKLNVNKGPSGKLLLTTNSTENPERLYRWERRVFNHEIPRAT